MADAVLLWRSWQADADILLLPTTGHRAFESAHPAPAQQADLTLLANFIGGPAVTLPIPAAQGPSITGLQAVARPGADAQLLAFAEQVDELMNGAASG